MRSSLKRIKDNVEMVFFKYNYRRKEHLSSETVLYLEISYWAISTNLVSNSRKIT